MGLEVWTAMAEDLERKRARQREYNRNLENRARRKALEATPERRAARQAWAAANKERRAALAKIHNARPETKERALNLQKKRRLTALGRAKSLLRGVRHRCRKRGLAYDLNADDIADRILNTVCPYIQQPFVLIASRHPFAPSIDRIDGTKGYTVDNISVVSLWWNVAKNVWPESVTITVLQGLKRSLQDMEFG